MTSSTISPNRRKDGSIFFLDYVVGLSLRNDFATRRRYLIQVAKMIMGIDH